MRRARALAVGLFLAATGILLTTTVPPLAAAAEKPRQPNIILVISDDHRWDALGAAGNPAVHTPNLDDLARRSVYYRQATIHVSQCPPSRATLLTGLPPHLHGHRSMQYQEPKATQASGLCRQTVPSLLRAAGYHTALVGKWHLLPKPWQCGFAEVRTWIPHGSAPYRDAKMAKGRLRWMRKRAGYTQEVLAAQAVDYLRSRKGKDQPFFLWLAFTAPHLPYAPNPPRIQKLYAGKSIPELLPPGLPPDAPTNPNWALYYEAVTQLDDQIGRVMKALAESGHGEDTVVVFLGDNGYMMGERGIGLDGPEGKVVPYESSLRVPFLVAGLPAPAPQGANDTPVSSLDIPPTLLRLAGLTPPAGWPGRDLVAALHGGEPIREAISEWSDNRGARFGPLAYRVIRTARYKLIDWEDPQKPDELYDFVADPRESRNLYEDPGSQAARENLAARLHAWEVQTHDPVIAKP